MTATDESESPRRARFARRLLKPRRQAVGARPGTIVIDPESPRPRISVISYGSKDFEQIDVDEIEELDGIIGRRSVTWINVDGLGDVKTLNALAAKFGFHRLMLEDIAHVHQRPKVEQYDQHVFLIARMVASEDQLDTEQVSIVLGDGFLISFQEHEGDCLGPVRKRLKSTVGRLRHTGPDFLAYALVDAIIDGYFPVLERYGEQLETIEAALLDQSGKESINRIHELRSELHVLRKAIWPHRELINSLLRDPLEIVTDETRTYLRDCYDHTIQLVEINETCREMCGDLRDLHFSQISIRQNDVMKVLTITATIFIPLSFIAGLYGMNFDSEASPFNMPELRWFYGYPFALGLMTAVAAGMLIYFRWKHWIGPNS
jgi:magnesium transporter